MKLSDFKAITFDVYGTLIDWESGIVNALRPLTDQISQKLSRDEILESHAYHESTTQQQTPAKKYRDVLATVYRRLAEEWGIQVTWEQCNSYGQSVGQWPAFKDSPDALIYLKEHYKLIVLTNTDNESFEGSNARLGVIFDHIYTAEDIGSYKPAAENFDYMLRALARQGIGKSEILHTAESLYHDHVPANRHGLSNCWIHRRHDQTGFGATMNPGTQPSIDFKFKSMADFVSAHQKEQKS